MAAHNPLLTPVKLRVSAAASRHLASLGIETVADAVSYAPRRYYSWGDLTDLSQLAEGEDVTVLARVVSQTLLRNRSGDGVRLLVTVTDGHRNLPCTFFARNPYALSRHQRLLQPGAEFLFGGKVGLYQGRHQLVQPSFEEIEAGSPDTLARQQGRPIPIYPAKASLPSWKVAALLGQILDKVDWEALPEQIPADVRAAHDLLPAGEAFRLLHQPQADTDWQRARRSLAWAEALTLQTALLAPRYQRAEDHRATPLPSAAPETRQLIDGLPFQLTAAQQQAWGQISAALGKDDPMQTLLQADVGAGKTVIALLAMVQATAAGKQAALLAPTSVLARQHFLSILRLLESSGLDTAVHLLTSSTPPAERTEITARLAAGEPGIVVATHALLQPDVEVPELALLVVDEQHRFGVAQREHLREGRAATPHQLVMTATPIPRTIAMTVFGGLDVVTMPGLPPGRSPVASYRVPADKPAWMARLWQRAREEIDAGGRVYVVCPRISPDPDSPELPAVEQVAAALADESALAGVSIGTVHGQMPQAEAAAALRDFATGDTPLLVATTVVEVGVDVPEASLMVILGAQQFGLSQLHQLRGRVGRGERPSACMFVQAGDLGPVADARLEAAAQTTDGFVLAEADLNLRHEGDVLSAAQSGTHSGLRFLSVRRDGAIIAAARQVAEQILGVDPTLADHPGLAAAVASRRGQEIAWLDRS